MVLATLPATPVQLAHACHALGFDIVIPASWGDELVAHAVLEEAAGRAREPVIQCTCPLVAERLRASGAHLEPYMVACVAPPVAAARYVRQAFSPRSVHVSYFGACPAAADPAIDAHYTPDEVIRWLDERGILVRDLPTVFDSVVPPDRRRWSSLPGGSPSQDALWRSGDGRMLREVTKASFAADLAQTLVWREHVLIDVAPAVGCPCSGSHAAPGSSGGRASVMAVEPPRAAAPVVPYVSGIARLEAKPSPPRPPQNGEVAADLPVPPSRSRLGDGTPAGMPDGNRVQAHAHSARDTAVSDAAVRGLPRAYLA
ncbi:MAG: [Fe-Fe] hydrogenase large subunit C-terminal domain-containing protein, partial [Gemmatimonadaceae bacterium]